MHNIFLKNPLRIPVHYSIFIIFILSGVLTIATLLLQTDSIFTLGFTFIGQKKSILILNFLPVCILMFFLFFLTGRLAISASTTIILFTVLSLINRFKIILRQDPLVPTDVMLGAESLTIVANMNVFTILKVVGLLILLVAICVAASIFIKNYPMNKWLRIYGCFFFIILAYVSNYYLYKNEELYERLPVVGNPYFLVHNYNTKGFTYCFLYELNHYKITKPLAYDKNNLESLLAGEDTQTAPDALKNIPKPHVFVIMGEAFSDISESEHLDFSAYRDPLEEYKKLRQDSITGHIMTPNMGGGTSDTEFDVLTGISTRELQLKPYSYRFLNKSIESMARWLGNLGYGNTAIHPGHAWFYNRNNAYEYLGFETMIFDEAFEDAELKGGYINETATYDAIIQAFEDHLQGDTGQPFFSFCVTIENHGPYDVKYDDIEPNFVTDIALTQSETLTLSNYFQGISNMDIELGRLATYLNELEEPAVLLYFGDHMPGILEEIYIKMEYPYDNEGTFRERTYLYHAPYIIWQNNTYQKQRNLKTISRNMGLPLQGTYMNSSYLGTTLMELLGFSEANPFVQFSNHMRKQYPITTLYEYMTPDGTTGTLDQIDTTELDFFWQWQYYRIFDDNSIREEIEHE